MALVQFTADVSPYCAGDVVDLDKDELKRVDEAAKARDLDKPYETVKAADKK